MTFGRALLSQFDLAPELRHLNHGSYGAVPKAVRAEQDRERLAIERDPTGFFQDVLPQRLRRAADAMARRFGGRGDDWVFVENATQAINGILQSLTLKNEDEIVATSHGYGAVLRAIGVHAQRCGASLRIVDLPWRLPDDEAIVTAIGAAITSCTRLVVIDHITSSTAAILPVADVIRVAHEKGAAVLVDGAHVPGQLALDVTALGADWYVGNVHKWLFAPRGCGVLFTSPEQQQITRPAVISWGRGVGYAADFDWIGTRDVTPWLVAESAARFHDAQGGADLMARNGQLASQACDYLSGIAGISPTTGTENRPAMASLCLGPETDPDRAQGLRRELARAHGIVVPVSHFGGRLWLRISAQLYNEIEDYQALGRALHALGFRA